VPFSWAAVPEATYYNLQLHRDGTKVFEAWPALPSLTFVPSPQGARPELEPALLRWYPEDGSTLPAGTYRWYVWAGFGERAEVRYGELHKQGSLRVDARGVTTR